MDIVTLLGTIIGFGLVLTAIMLGGNLSLFVDIPSLMITVGGTLASTSVTFPLGDVVDSFGGALALFVKK